MLLIASLGSGHRGSKNSKYFGREDLSLRQTIEVVGINGEGLSESQWA